MSRRMRVMVVSSREEKCGAGVEVLLKFMLECGGCDISRIEYLDGYCNRNSQSLHYLIERNKDEF